jgi:hypothetical protein
VKFHRLAMICCMATTKSSGLHNTIHHREPPQCKHGKQWEKSREPVCSLTDYNYHSVVT